MAYLIAFDLDGTLIDSQLDLAESANELLQSCGAAPLPVAAVAGMVGDGARVLVGRVLQSAHVDHIDLEAALNRFLAIYDRRLAIHTRPYPGVVDALRAVSPRATLAILTNKPAHHTTRILEAFSLAGWFADVIGGDSGFPRKPDPSGLRHLMARSAAAAPETLMVGDTTVDLETGRRAGVRLCAVGYGFARFRGGLDLTGDELVADTPADLQTRLVEFLDGVARDHDPESKNR